MSADIYRELAEINRRLNFLDSLESRMQGVYAEYLQLPALRFFLPMSSVDDTGKAYDISGQARHFTYNGNPTYNNYASTLTPGYYAPYLDLDGTGDYLDRADEAGLDVIGNEAYVASAIRGLTVGCWVWMDATSSYRKFITKGDGATAAGSAWDLIASGGDSLFSVYSGVSSYSVTGSALSTGRWYFVVAKYEPSTRISVSVNLTKVSNTTTIPATINNVAASVYIGGQAGANNHDGRLALMWLCAAAVSDTQSARIYNATHRLFDV